jgi:putative ABC transport system permease protein
LLVDESGLDKLFSRLKALPTISAISVRRAAVDTFYETMGETVLTFVWFFIGFGCTLAFGIVYNSNRISLSERGRELATLRVLGFGRGEVSYILLGEVAFLTLVGLPIGCLTGYALCGLVLMAFDTELFRVPFFLEASTYGLSVLIALAATVASMALVRRRLDRLDLIAVLKSRE